MGYLTELGTVEKEGGCKYECIQPGYTHSIVTQKQRQRTKWVYKFVIMHANWDIHSQIERLTLVFLLILLFEKKKK